MEPNQNKSKNKSENTGKDKSSAASSELGVLDKLNFIHSATGAQVVGFLEILKRNISGKKISDHYEKNLQFLSDAETGKFPFLSLIGI